eukprot:NODE_19668_length_833_cov_1.399433.p1 GENE.NODE_19668_length_833_cov_1.399433~~NODE_19668_length_833_cov_1.399433.p1  ORF type:complete len:253 (+),score=53.01 NODE_19668_length_833_cov_1.399433:2-760(+)
MGARQKGNSNGRGEGMSAGKGKDKSLSRVCPGCRKVFQTGTALDQHLACKLVCQQAVRGTSQGEGKCDVKDKGKSGEKDKSKGMHSTIRWRPKATSTPGTEVQVQVPISLPGYWTSVDGNAPGTHPVWIQDELLLRALAELLDVTRPEWLGVGKDCVSPLGRPYRRLELVAAWRLEDAARWAMYQAQIDHIRAQLNQQIRPLTAHCGFPGKGSSVVIHDSRKKKKKKKKKKQRKNKPLKKKKNSKHEKRAKK